MNLRRLEFTQDRLGITWVDGHRSEYASVWLLDNAPEHRDSRNGQRLVDVADLPANPLIGHASCKNGALLLSWLEGQAAALPLEWLRAHCPCGEHDRPQLVRLWPASDSDILRRFPYDDVRNSAAERLEWLRAISSYGLGFLAGVPTNDGRVLEVAALVGWVRDTNYGRVFDVRAVADPNNLAYTGLALGLHTDNPYRDPVPGLQILHSLRAGAEGGDSIFADGFAIAESVLLEDAPAFVTLTGTPVRFEFCDAGCHLTAERPIIETGRNGLAAAIHYNNRSIAPVSLPPVQAAEFYRAYRAFAVRLRESRFVLNTRLAEGDVAVFDNRRVLHGRTAFASSGLRHLQGCYLDRDGLLSNIAVLERESRGSRTTHSGAV